MLVDAHVTGGPSKPPLTMIRTCSWCWSIKGIVSEVHLSRETLTSLLELAGREWLHQQCYVHHEQYHSSISLLKSVESKQWCAQHSRSQTVMRTWQHQKAALTWWSSTPPPKKLYLWIQDHACNIKISVITHSLQIFYTISQHHLLIFPRKVSTPNNENPHQDPTGLLFM